MVHYVVNEDTAKNFQLVLNYSLNVSLFVVTISSKLLCCFLYVYVLKLLVVCRFITLICHCLVLKVCKTSLTSLVFLKITYALHNKLISTYGCQATSNPWFCSMDLMGFYKDSVMLHCRRGGLHFPWQTVFCVTDDESSVYCCIAPIRLFSRVDLHNTISPILCDILPSLCRTELSRGQQPNSHRTFDLSYSIQCQMLYYKVGCLYFYISVLMWTRYLHKDKNIMIIWGTFWRHFSSQS